MSEAKLALEKLNQLDQKLINVLSKTADILETMAALSSPSQAQELVNQKPEEFAQLLQDIREEFFHLIETAPKPGIPYYDPKPLTDLLETVKNNEMHD